MARETKYTANTGIIEISKANSNLDGTGALGSLITGSSNGTLIKTICIKAQGSTNHGMIRLFESNGSTTKLLREIKVPAIAKTSRNPGFEICIPVNFYLESAHVLKVSTEKAETFNIIAEGLDWAYHTSSVRPESARFTANTGLVTISTANSNSDGSGSITNVLSASSSGTQIQSIRIKAQASTSAGMIRLFIYDGTNPAKLFREIPVPYVNNSATSRSFEHVMDFNNIDFALKAEYSLQASTEKAEAFNIIAEGLDWTYPA